METPFNTLIRGPNKKGEPKFKESTKVYASWFIIVAVFVYPLLIKRYNPFGFSDLTNIFLIVGTIGALIIRYFFSLLKDKGYKLSRADPLNRAIFQLDWIDRRRDISFWPLSHFVMFTSLAISFPSHWKAMVAIGIGWELFEEWLAYWMSKNPAATEALSDPTTAKLVSKTQYGNYWWAGSTIDIAANLLGILVGVSVAMAVTCSSCSD